MLVAALYFAVPDKADKMLGICGWVFRTCALAESTRAPCLACHNSTIGIPLARVRPTPAMALQEMQHQVQDDSRIRCSRQA